MDHLLEGYGETVVTIYGTSKKLSEEALRRFYESKRKSGGGKIKKIIFKHETKIAEVIFGNTCDAAEVVSIGTSMFCGHRLNASWSSTDHVGDMANNDAHLYNRNQLQDALSFAEEKESQGNIQIHGITNKLSMNAAQMFYSSKRKSGGGTIDAIIWKPEENVAHITFRNKEDAAEVVSMGKSKLHNHTLSAYWASSEHTGKQPAYGSSENLEYHKLKNLSTISVTRGFRGGWPKKKLTPLPGYVKVVYGIDMLTLEEDPYTELAQMQCGHVIGSESMTAYIKEMVQEGRMRFYCPAEGCNREWPYFVVRHVAGLSDTELEEIETAINEDYIIQNEGCRQCPRCKTWCFRQYTQHNRMECQVCPTNGLKGRDVEFCWECCRPWLRPNETSYCGHPDCYGKDPRLCWLQECPFIEIENVTCPSVRCCPKCPNLIEHGGGFKHMICTMCKNEFCFICLKSKVSGSWQCGSYCTPCPAAPLQTELGHQ